MELTDASVTAILAHTPRTNKPNGGGGVYERNDLRSRVDAAVLHTCAANADSMLAHISSLISLLVRFSSLARFRLS